MNKREQLYDEVASSVAKRQVIDLSDLLSGNNNRLFIIDETLNDFGGNHYAGVYHTLFQHYEKIGRIKPGDVVIESGTGSASLAFSMIGKYLGYEPVVILPQNTDEIIKTLTQPYTTEIIYTTGWAQTFKDAILKTIKTYNGALFMNHSMRKGPEEGFVNNELTLQGIQGIGEKMVSHAYENGIKVEYFVPMIGNGTSVLGPGRIIKHHMPKSKIIGVEPFSAGFVFDKQSPGLYLESYGIEPGAFLSDRPLIRGTSRNMEFPHVNNSMQYLEDIKLISDQVSEDRYFDLIGRNTDLPQWDVANLNNLQYGKTTRACIASILDMDKNHKGKNFYTIGYDSADLYSDLT